MGFWCHKNLVLVLGDRNPAHMKTIAKLSSSDILISSTVKKTCAELYKSGQKISGVYTIDPDGSGTFDVFCDQKTAGGGWTVFQKRLDGSVDFSRGWNDYKRGFGNLNGEFWLGLDKINRLTKAKSRLRVDLEDTKGNTAYADYDFFAVSSERNKYKLSLGFYSGKFSTETAVQVQCVGFRSSAITEQVQIEP